MWELREWSGVTGAGRSVLRLFGPDHAVTLDSVHAVARTQIKGGKAESAVPLFERVLEGRERSLGADHPMSDAASLYHAVFNEAMHDYGPYHPETVRTRRALADASHGGKDRGAADEWQEPHLERRPSSEAGRRARP
ncbi:hypothetical protein FRACA_1100007 [Frankia canadensis]|uniref:Tetratricopeptide repeat protein n=1 Tax=Frankia canadensis TaxID=1836972 RepID=A0A2I2KJC1_9ACTN|nr:hypothetical protein FRACA_1100007 [Frankia canadensis]SOU53044.1 hypothetical protein FRACA_1100007 [Frankia canadensis]